MCATVFVCMCVCVCVRVCVLTPTDDVYQSQVLPRGGVGYRVKLRDSLPARCVTECVRVCVFVAGAELTVCLKYNCTTD